MVAKPTPFQPHTVKSTSPRTKTLLTKRESQVLSLVFAGYQNPEIAERLGIGLWTVKQHLRNIYERLDCSPSYGRGGFRELVARSIRCGLLTWSGPTFEAPLATLDDPTD